VQVDPITPTLKAPGTKRLKQKYVNLLLNCGTKFNLRCYIKAALPERFHPRTIKAGHYTHIFGPTRQRFLPITSRVCNRAKTYLSTVSSSTQAFLRHSTGRLNTNLGWEARLKIDTLKFKQYGPG